MKKDIFEELIHRMPTCQYISDLRAMIEKGDVNGLLQTLTTIEYNDYTFEQWQELIQYLFQETQEYKNSQDIYDALINKLKR